MSRRDGKPSFLSRFARLRGSGSSGSLLPYGWRGQHEVPAPALRSLRPAVTPHRCAPAKRSGECEQKETGMPTGTVKWFNETKGYGFIQPDQGGKDVFVHVSAVERSGMRGLAEGMKISYEVQADRRTGKESAVDLKTA